jgi:hypothetical protein
METLKLLQQPKRKKIPGKLPILSNIKKDDDLTDLFPLPAIFSCIFSLSMKIPMIFRMSWLNLIQTVDFFGSHPDSYFVF